jgi:predicted porin
MRKLLLGTTAVIGAALFAPTIASAQMTPPPAPIGATLAEGLTARLGGYFRFNYAIVNQDGANQPDANTGASDFTSDAEVQAIVLGKAANGLVYGALIEFQTDLFSQRQQQQDIVIPPTTPGGTSTTRTATFSHSKTVVDTDEMYMFIAHPMVGQFRLGDEDGVAMGLMTSGHITNFGTGGVDGDGYDVIQGAIRATNFFPAGALPDSTKIIYLSPQFFGFDVGISYGWNWGEGEDTGCGGTTQYATCDRTGAATGGNLGRWRNELQLGLRWRGTFGGVGIGVSGLAGFADPIQPLGTAAGNRREDVSWYNIGAQLSAFGFLVGGHWTQGNGVQAGGGTLQRTGGSIVDSSDLEQWFFGASYTIGQFTVGANWYQTMWAGAQNLRAQRRESAFSLGATYTVAPGLAIVAEWLQQQRKENGFNFVTGANNPTATPGLNSDVTANVYILGTRIAF